MEINLSKLPKLLGIGSLNNDYDTYINSIHKSIDNNDIEKLQILIEECKNDEDKFKFEELAISYVCNKNYIETIKSLLEKYKSFREKDKFEELILYYAFNTTIFGRIEIINFLYEKDINFLSENNFNDILKDIFIGIDYHKKDFYRFDMNFNVDDFANFFILINLLLSKNLKLTINESNLYNIYETFEDNKYSSDTIKYLLERGINIDTKISNGFSLLMLACIHGKLDDVKYLIDKGANIEVRSDKQYTPLIFACEYNNFELVKYLIKKGANIETKDKDGWTPLMHVCKYNHPYMGEDMDIKTKLRDKNNSFEIVKYLIKKGADVNQESSEKKYAERPIRIAYYHENIEIVKYLLDHGAYIL